jgi:hypothetical protein
MDKSSPSELPETVTLYRPVGPTELALVEESGFRAFPPRLTSQPIFYPVLTEEYATQIARDWNVKSSGAGLCCAFASRRALLIVMRCTRSVAQSTSSIGFLRKILASSTVTLSGPSSLSPNSAESGRGRHGGTPGSSGDPLFMEHERTPFVALGVMTRRKTNCVWRFSDATLKPSNP